MAKKANNNDSIKKKKKRIQLLICWLMGTLAIVIIASMGYIFYTGNHMVAVHTPQIDATMEIKQEAITSHLWLEEIISGDVDKSINDVLAHLEQADWYAKALLEGGLNPEGKFIPLKDIKLREEINEVRSKLTEFRSITLQRWNAREVSGVGSEIDQKYDALFADFIKMVDNVETNLQRAINLDLRIFRITQAILLALCSLVTVIVGIAISRLMHQQIEDEIKLYSANQQLDASNQQLDASNQQLRAHEQQLKAANQQLRASEEHLKQTNHSLGERVKELNCLYDLSHLAERGDIALDEIFQGLAKLIPPGWQYPEITAARITFEGRQFETSNFQKTTWIESTDIKVHAQKAGSIEVCYLEKMPIIDEGPFLKEERSLLNALAERVGSIISRKQAEESLKTANQQLNASNQQFDASNQQLRANEQQLKAANQQLLAHEQQLKANQKAIEALARFTSENPYPVLRISKEGVVLYSNSTGKEVLADWGSEVGMKVPESQCRYVAEVLESGLTKEFETSFCEDRIMSLTMAPVMEAEYVNIYGLDITKRKRAEEAMQKTHEKLKTSIDNMPNAYILCDTQTLVLEWNRTAEKIFGYSKEEILGKNIIDFIVPEKARHLVEKAVKKLKVGEVADYSEKDNNIRKDGKLISCQWFNTPLTDTNGKVFGILFMAQDITERKRAEEALEAANQQLKADEQQLKAANQQLKAANQQLIASEQQLKAANQQLKAANQQLKASEEKLATEYNLLRTLIDNMPDSIYFKDSQSRFVIANTHLANRMGVADPEQLIGKTDADFYPPELVKKYYADEQQIIKTGKPLIDREENVIDQNTGETIWSLVTKVPLLDSKENVTGIIGIGRNITVRKHAEEKLQKAYLEMEQRVLERTADLAETNEKLIGEIQVRKQVEKEITVHHEQLHSLASQLSITEERTRKHIAEQLHDDALQTLIFLKMKFEDLRKLGESPEFAKTLNRINKETGNLIQRLRVMTFDLSSPMLYELGLSAAIKEWLTREIQEKCNISTKFEDDGKAEPLDENLCILLYRAVRELLTNVVKHAEAKSVKVFKKKQGEKIIITVEDDGKGFTNPEKMLKSNTLGGFGLFSINERLSQYNGSLEIVDIPTGGTRVVLTVPLKK